MTDGLTGIPTGHRLANEIATKIHGPFVQLSHDSCGAFSWTTTPYEYVVDNPREAGRGLLGHAAWVIDL